MVSAPARSGCLSRLAALVLLLLGGVGLSSIADRPQSPDQAQAGPNDFELNPSREPGLFAQLRAGDQAWVPRAEPIPGGGTRYVYRKPPDQPPLTLEQIKALMRDPPTFHRERQVIGLLLSDLRRAGVMVVLGPPQKQGAAGEWDPSGALLRIRPDIPSKGSREFARVLNHEAIHVAQSCRRGALNAQPKPLGLSRAMSPTQARYLDEPLYRQSSPLERLLEEEAYANQDRLQLGAQLIRAHCRIG
jgi:hypothetical protein